MVRRWAWARMLLLLGMASGCRYGGPCWPYAAPPMYGGPAISESEGVVLSEPAAAAGTDTCAAPSARLGAPSCESKPPRTVFVRGPQQKIVIERDCPPAKERQGAPMGAPQPRPSGEAAMMQQDVILVPRTVYVPYVAQTPTMAARLVQPLGVAPPATPEEPLRSKAPPPKEEAPKERLKAPPPEECPTECEPTTIIEIRQMNERIDRLHRILERLTPGHRN